MQEKTTKRNLSLTEEYPPKKRVPTTWTAGQDTVNTEQRKTSKQKRSTTNSEEVKQQRGKNKVVSAKSGADGDQPKADITTGLLSDTVRDTSVNDTVPSPKQNKVPSARSDGSSSCRRRTEKKSKKKKKAAVAEVAECKEPVDKACLDYLHTWKSNRKQWSFKKVRQVWLLQNMYDSNKVREEDFEIMLEYMIDLKGHARQMTAEKAEKMLADENISDEQEERARQIIQILT